MFLFNSIKNRPVKPATLCLSFMVLTACVSTSELPAQAHSEISEINTTTDHFDFGNMTSSAWVSEKFEGEKSRQFRSDSLYFTVAQSHPEGGLDVGLSERGWKTASVLKAKDDLRICSTYLMNLEGEGRWWAGPKISVNWQGDEAAKQNGDDWYENYIVEIASSTPEDLHEIFTGDYFKAEILPPLTVSGAEYKNYKIRFHSWWQFWSVRQDYRESGTLDVEPILDLWLSHGLPQDRIFDGIKANVETYGDIQGDGALKMKLSNKEQAKLECL